MTKFSLTVLAFAMLFACEEGTANKGNGDGEMNEFIDSVAYVIGANFGKQLHRDSVKLDLEVFMDGMKTAFKGDSSVISDAEAEGLMMRFQQQMQEEQQKRAAEAMQANVKKGQEFLAKTRTEPGVQATESGLLYKVIQEGNGAKPDSNDRVKVHYTGKLTDGTVFDSSVERGEPTEFAVNRVIPGWTEGLQLMSPGAKYMLYIPSELAYGERGAGQNIGPNETLVFEVELLEVTKQ